MFSTSVCFYSVVDSDAQWITARKDWNESKRRHELQQSKGFTDSSSAGPEAGRHSCILRLYFRGGDNFLFVEWLKSIQNSNRYIIQWRLWIQSSSISWYVTTFENHDWNKFHHIYKLSSCSSIPLSLWITRRIGSLWTTKYFTNPYNKPFLLMPLLQIYFSLAYDRHLNPSLFIRH